MTDPMRDSDAEPRGSAGLVNQGSTSTVDAVAPVYAEIIVASEQASQDKRDADWMNLMGGNYTG